MSNRDQDWPFDNPKNAAVFTVRQIVRGGEPILRVSHDANDGAWQFLQWNTPREEDAMVLALEEVVQLDPSVKELADLPLGWRAWRRKRTDPWTREPQPADD